MIFSILSSGSRGNSIYVESGDTRLLVDNGLSYKELTKRMAAIGRTPDQLTAVVVSHCHGDHVDGIGVLDRKSDWLPVWITPDTYASYLRKQKKELTFPRFFEAGEPFFLNPFTPSCIYIQSYSVKHDAVDPVCFILQDSVSRLGVITDLGIVESELRNGLQGCTGLIVESNYSPGMMDVSSYPEQVNDRIQGDYGHLSNRQAVELVSDLKHDGLEVVVAVHLSEENNSVGMVEGAMQVALKDTATRFEVSRQDEAMALIRLGGEG